MANSESRVDEITLKIRYRIFNWLSIYKKYKSFGRLIALRCLYDAELHDRCRRILLHRKNNKIYGSRWWSGGKDSPRNRALNIVVARDGSKCNICKTYLER